MRCRTPRRRRGRSPRGPLRCSTSTRPANSPASAVGQRPCSVRRLVVGDQHRHVGHRQQGADEQIEVLPLVIGRDDHGPRPGHRRPRGAIRPGSERGITTGTPWPPARSPRPLPAPAPPATRPAARRRHRDHAEAHATSTGSIDWDPEALLGKEHERHHHADAAKSARSPAEHRSSHPNEPREPQRQDQEVRDERDHEVTHRVQAVGRSIGTTCRTLSSPSAGPPARVVQDEARTPRERRALRSPRRCVPDNAPRTPGSRA